MQTKWVALCLVVCIGLIVPVAEGAATKAKCKCDLNDANDNEDGAEVTNAAECLLEEDEGDDWCEFEVESLEGSSSHRQFVMQLSESLRAGPGVGAELLSARLRKFHEYRRAIAETRGLEPPSDEVVNEMRNRLGSNKNAVLLSSCLEVFAIKGERSLELAGDASFGCGVHPSGWLTVGFGFEGFRVLYLLGSPPRM